MKEIYTSMEFRKFLSEDVVAAPLKITYLWYANYAAESPFKKEWYTGPADESQPIWRIKKIVENTTTKTTETFYPDADPAKTYAWSDRAILNYI